MKRWMALLIIFALMGSAIAMISCTWEEFDEFMGGHYGCGCFWDCTKDVFGSWNGTVEYCVSADGGVEILCESCVEGIFDCTCTLLEGLFCDDE